MIYIFLVVCLNFLNEICLTLSYKEFNHWKLYEIKTIKVLYVIISVYV